MSEAPSATCHPHSPPNREDPVLAVADLRTHFATEAGDLPAVDGVTFSIRRGRTLALVGE